MSSAARAAVTPFRPRSPPVTPELAPPEETDWVRIAQLYAELARLAPSPVVELNRAVAVAMAFGPAAGLEIVDALTSEPSLRGYHLLPTVRGDLLAKLGRFDEARAEFERAAALTRNARERDLLLERARAWRQESERRRIQSDGNSWFCNNSSSLVVVPFR